MPVSLILLCAIISFVNFAIHGAMTGLIVLVTRRTAAVTDHLTVFFRLAALLTVTMVALMVAHIAEVGVWAAGYAAWSVNPDQVGPLEFAFENYAALGYGDAVPRPERRLVGPVTALNGLLLIGWSVAIIFEVMRMAEVQFDRMRRDD
jgi:hypothetical protein